VLRSEYELKNKESKDWGNGKSRSFMNHTSSHLVFLGPLTFKRRAF
jgi:hypothetical protein